MLTVDQALDQLLSSLSPLGSEQIPLAEAAGRVLAGDVRAARPLPPFDNSAMDGYALRADDVRLAGESSPVRLKVVDDVPAGAGGRRSIRAGEAARIMTGAMLPEGADAVLPVEQTDFPLPMEGQPLPEEIRASRAVAAGANVRRAGQDVALGAVALPEGQRLRPQDVGMLAALGQAAVEVVRQPRVGLLSTGSELVPVDHVAGAGQIYDSNGPALAAAVRSAGGVPLDLGIAEDSVESVAGRLDEAVQARVDLLVTSAGVSMGAFDCVRAALEFHGRIAFWQVRIRPGKPMTFGTYRGTPVVGLPGNPVSAMVAFDVFVRPAIDRLQGLKATRRQRLVVRLSEPVRSDGRQSYLRCRVSWTEGELWATLTGPQGSGILSSMVHANALMIVPTGVEYVEAGERLDAWLVDGASLV
jgi:molybdopterin molybdotransferase